MEPIIDFFAGFGVDFWLMLKAFGLILLCVLVMGLIGRYLFGKKSRINHAITSAICIVYIYAIAAAIRTIGSEFNWLIAPLPFTFVSGDSMTIFNFSTAAMQPICEEVLCMVVLAFLVNLADTWLPRGRNAFTWFLLRTANAGIGWGVFLVIDWLSNAYLPGVILQNAPMILLGLLIVLILLGALKLLVGVLLASVNPIIGALYTFFFANIVGRQITKAMFTTALLAGLITLLRALGVVTLGLGVGCYVAYLPFLLLMLIIWYPVSRKL